MMKIEAALGIKDLTEAQQEAVTRLYEREGTLLVAAMGSGKTVVTLTAISELIGDQVVGRVLLIAPLKVAKTVWAQECQKWTHLQGLDVAVAVGNERERLGALGRGADVVVINFENLPWLVKQKAMAGFDALVVDELSRMKQTGGTQFRALRPRLGQFKWRVGLTGTPVSEDWLGLFGQMLIVDQGAALGTRAAAFKERFFYPLDFQGYKWALREGAAEQIAGRISKDVYTLPDYRGALPEIKYETVVLAMPEVVQECYDRLKRDSVLIMEDAGGVISAASAAVLINKLQQCGNGFMYTEGGGVVRVSDYRSRAVAEHVALLKQQGRPCLLAYWFKEDFDAIKGALTRQGVKFKAVADDGVEACVTAWNGGELDCLLVHPRSAGHGLNLAAGGADVVWYGPVWSRDLWEQTNARLWRRGQSKPVTVWTFCAGESVDTLVIDRVEDKAEFQRLFNQHLGG